MIIKKRKKKQGNNSSNNNNKHKNCEDKINRKDRQIFDRYKKNVKAIELAGNGDTSFN